jgi:hypothetical protein
MIMAIMVVVLIPVGLFYITGADLFWFLRPVAYLRKTRNGEIAKTRIHIDKNNVKWAYVYPFTRLGHVILVEDGSTKGETSNVYSSWSLEKPKSKNTHKQTIEERNAQYLR